MLCNSAGQPCPGRAWSLPSGASLLASSRSWKHRLPMLPGCVAMIWSTWVGLILGSHYCFYMWQSIFPLNIQASQFGIDRMKSQMCFLLGWEASLFTTSEATKPLPTSELIFITNEIRGTFIARMLWKLIEISLNINQSFWILGVLKCREACMSQAGW